MTKIIIIAALSENRTIGDKGKIPWHIPEDFKLFKEKTKDCVIIMGRKTWESLPKRPLPNRINIVITHRELPEYVPVFTSLSESIKYCEDHFPQKTIFLCGGSGIYREGIENHAQEMYLSHVKGEFEGDTKFPEFEKEKWEAYEEEKFEEFIFKKYRRKN